MRDTQFKDFLSTGVSFWGLILKRIIAERFYCL